jgi:hypothetical protein
MYKKDELLTVLRKQIAVVSFVKKDGTNREMRCTLNMSFIPQNKHPKSTVVSDYGDIIRVYDVEKNEWRSFDINNVFKMEM